MGRLSGRKAIITGASSGIGQAIAIAFAREDVDMVLSYNQHESGIQETLKQLKIYKRRVLIVQANLADKENIDRLVDKSIQFLGAPDILVNNAGTLTRHSTILEIPIDEFDSVQAVNLKAPFILTQAFGKQMIVQNNGGVIINISSISAEIASPGLAHYECSKAALNALTRATASELAVYNIRANAIEPGLIATKLNQIQRETNPTLWQNRISKIPLGRAGSAHDIAEMAVFLASPEASWITGAVLTVDGGLSIS